MFGKFISDNDQLQVGKCILSGEFSLQRRECLDNAHHVFMWADAAGVEQKRMDYLIAFREQLPVGFGRVPSQEARIDRVVDDFNLSRFDPKQFLNLVLGELRDREDSRRILQHSAGEMKM